MKVEHRRQRAGKVLPGVAAALVLQLAMGCAVVRGPAPREAGDVEWRTALNGVGLAAVIPPSEDIRVGDVFVFPFEPDRGGQTAGLTRWSSLPVRALLAEEYEGRPPWPETTEGDDGVAPAREDAAPPQGGFFDADARRTGLPQMALYLFMSRVLQEGDVRSLVPTEVLNLVFGSDGGGDKTVVLSPKGSESYSLSLQRLLPLVVRRLPDPPPPAPVDADAEEAGVESAPAAPAHTGYALRGDFLPHLELMADPGRDRVWVRVITEVVYLRSLDVVVESNDAFDAADDLRASEIRSGPPVFVVAPDEDAGAVEIAEPGDSEPAAPATIEIEVEDHEIDPGFAAFVRARAINEALIEGHADDYPGGYVRFLAVTDDSVTLRRFWRQGLAVATRGLTLEVDPRTGIIHEFEATGGDAPAPSTRSQERSWQPW